MLRPLMLLHADPFVYKPGGGFSMIFGPDGKPLCEPMSDGEEGILKADINLRDIDYPKAFIDVVGHCKRKKARILEPVFARLSILHNSVLLAWHYRGTNIAL